MSRNHYVGKMIDPLEAACAMVDSVLGGVRYADALDAAIASRGPIARCSCGDTVWYGLPEGTQSSEIGGFVWHSLECPRCHSGVVAVSNERGLLTEDEAKLILWGKGGVW